MPFDQIRGHGRQLRILQAMLRSGHLPHALLFTGMQGIGKRTVAEGFVMALNCTASGDDFCGQCLQCRKIQKMTHPDVLTVEPEPEKKVIRIEQIRDLQQDLAFKPLEGRKKAVIIGQAARMNVQAANCLLKTLEEPPADTVIVLVAQAASDMLPTVLSRCQRIHFSPLADEDILSMLAGRGIAEDLATRVLPLAQGSLQRALMLAESDFFSRRVQMAAQLAGRQGGSVLDELQLAEEIARDEEQLPLALEFLESWYRDLLVLLEAGRGARLYNADVTDMLEQAAAAETRASVLEKLRRLRLLQAGAAFNPDVQLGLEAVLLH